jgi:xanthine/uracil permease
MSWIANLAVGSAILLCGVSTLLFVVGLISYMRLRHGRLLWVGFAFLLLALQGIFLAKLAYDGRADIAGGDTGLASLSVIGLGIVLALYLAVIKR